MVILIEKVSRFLGRAMMKKLILTIALPRPHATFSIKVTFKFAYMGQTIYVPMLLLNTNTNNPFTPHVTGIILEELHKFCIFFSNFYNLNKLPNLKLWLKRINNNLNAKNWVIVSFFRPDFWWWFISMEVRQRCNISSQYLQNFAC